MTISLNTDTKRGLTFLASLGLLAGMAGAQAPVERRAPVTPTFQNPDLSVTPFPIKPTGLAGIRAHDIVIALVENHDSIKAGLALPDAGPARETFLNSLSTRAGRDKVEPLVDQAVLVLGLAKKAFTIGGAAETEMDMAVFHSEAGKLAELQANVIDAGGLSAIKMAPRIADNDKPAKLINVFLQLNDQGFVLLNEDEWKSLQKDTPIPERNKLAQEAMDIQQTIFDRTLSSLAGSGPISENLRQAFADAEKPLVLEQINGGLLQLDAAYKIAASGYNHPNEGARSTFNYVLEQLLSIEAKEKEIRDRVLAPHMPRASLEGPADGLRERFDRYVLPVTSGIAYS